MFRMTLFFLGKVYISLYSCLTAPYWTTFVIWQSRSQEWLSKHGYDKNSVIKCLRFFSSSLLTLVSWLHSLFRKLMKSPQSPTELQANICCTQSWVIWTQQKLCSDSEKLTELTATSNCCLCPSICCSFSSLSAEQSSHVSLFHCCVRHFQSTMSISPETSWRILLRNKNKSTFIKHFS